MKKGVIIGIIAGIIFILLIIGFFVLTNHPNNQINDQNKDKNLDQNTFSSCQASTRTTPFGEGSYIIKIIGIENGNCHWQFSLQLPQGSQTTDCNYPADKMSNEAFNHLFGQDKTDMECSSEVCTQQESLQQTYCKQM